MKISSYKKNHVTLFFVVLNIDNNQGLVIDSCQDSDDESKLLSYVSTSQHKKLTLSRSKTTIIEIPGLPAGHFIDESLDCSCAACLQWATFQSSTNVSRDTKFEQPSGSCNIDPKVEQMKEIYQSFDSLKAKKRFFSQTGYVVPMRNRKRKLIKRVVKKRYLLIFFLSQ